MIYLEDNLGPQMLLRDEHKEINIVAVSIQHYIYENISNKLKIVIA